MHGLCWLVQTISEVISTDIGYNPVVERSESRNSEGIYLNPKGSKSAVSRFVTGNRII